jgi:hypothetical protein
MGGIQPFYARDVGNGEIPGVERLVERHVVPRQDITVFLPERQGLPFDPAWERRVNLHQTVNRVQIIRLMNGHSGQLGDPDDGDEGLYAIGSGNRP